MIAAFALGLGFAAGVLASRVWLKRESRRGLPLPPLR